MAPADSAQIPFPPPMRGNRVLINGIGRLKPGLTLAQAQARLTAMAAQLRHDFPTDYPPQAQWTIEIQPLQETLVGNVRPMLLVLLGAVILIVFIVSLNIANLLLARATGRQQEMAVRLALGASRGRMVRQMLTESMLLSLIGGAAGIVTAVGTLGFIVFQCLVLPNDTVPGFALRKEFTATRSIIVVDQDVDPSEGFRNCAGLIGPGQLHRAG